MCFALEVYIAKFCWGWLPDIDGLVQDCSISIAIALEILQHCTKPSMCADLRTVGYYRLQFSEQLIARSYIWLLCMYIHDSFHGPWWLIGRIRWLFLIDKIVLWWQLLWDKFSCLHSFIINDINTIRLIKWGEWIGSGFQTVCNLVIIVLYTVVTFEPVST